ncbi:MAG: hypothetical protein OXP12_00250 [Thaumarchaeota archaeon]|nr:hypothetical protein [Nitrososphaerota archaeon]MDE0266468.1 hypothetical protein [Nitrososphaerota archaeon]
MPPYYVSKRPGGPRRQVRRDSGGKKRPARSYRNSGYGRGDSRDGGASRGAGRGGPRRGARQQGRAKPARRNVYGARSGADAPKSSRFYDAVREKLFEMLGGKVCSGCGFKDPRALGIASRYGDAPFDSVGRGGPISSSWSRYESDPELASSELMVLCLNCNRIREPISRKDSGDARADKKTRERRFPR